MHFITMYLLQKMKKFSSLGSCNQSKMIQVFADNFFCQSTNILWVDHVHVHVVRISIKFRGTSVVKLHDESFAHSSQDTNVKKPR